MKIKHNYTYQSDPCIDFYDLFGLILRRRKINITSIVKYVNRQGYYRLLILKFRL